MTRQIIQAFRNLKMRSQIISIYLFILFIVFGIAGAAIYIEIKIFYYISQRSLENTLEIQDIKQITLTTHLMKHYIKEKHNLSIQLVDHISSFLFHYTKIQKEIKFTNQVDRCLTLDEYLDDIYIEQKQKMCYLIYGNIKLDDALQQSSDIYQLYNGLRLLENFGLEFNLFYPDFIQFVDISNISFNSLYPFGYQVPNYDLHNRPWYVDHIKKVQSDPSQQYFFTDVYKMITGDYNYYFSITQSLFNQNKNFFGILKVMLSVNDQNLQNVKSNIILINQFGQVIYNGMETQKINNSQTFYVYNETITGFNESDWKQMEDDSMYHSNLKLKNQNQFSKCLILYNKYYKSYVHLRSEKFEKENFTLIIFTNITSKLILKDKFEKAYLESESQILIAAFSILFLGALSISISICYINMICLPLIEINRKISTHVLSVGNNVNEMIFKILQSKKRSQNLFTKLNEQIWSLYDTIQIRQKRKCEQCILIEKMFYDRKQISLNPKPIKIGLSQIPNNVEVDRKEFQQFLYDLLQQFKVQEI
ncbi:unnamed protein product [Paramecium sonneborni]|uniref:Transmembrane protein n=1 Tax=Paramecium sonneborni TaxID=65129 RepID=A0A8S1N8R4_9CILI|nr:unnamed protein product [Paramecium sonneborni]